MPGNLVPADPVETMPYTLASAFQEVLFLDASVNEYADGRSERRAQAINPRRSFRLSRRVTDEQLSGLRTFYLTTARYGKPFWFYHFRETVPVYSWDSTGGDPIGRYTVVWEGGWNETLNLGRHDTSVILREVA